MAKTLIDIDEDLLAKAQQMLGTTTKKDTVNAALRELLRRRAAVELLDLGRAGAFRDLLDPQVAEPMWR